MNALVSAKQIIAVLRSMFVGMLCILFSIPLMAAGYAPQQPTTQYPIDGNYDVVASPISSMPLEPETLFHIVAQTTGALTNGKDWLSHPTRSIEKLIVYDSNREYYIESASASTKPNDPPFPNSLNVSDGNIQFAFSISIDYYGRIKSATMSWMQNDGTPASKIYLSGETQSQEGVLTLSKNDFKVSIAVLLPRANPGLPNQPQSPTPIFVGYDPATTYSTVLTNNPDRITVAYGPTSIYTIKWIFVNGQWGYNLTIS